MIDPSIKHPAYVDFAPSWSYMRDLYDGEDAVKAAGEKYLPIKSGTAAITDPTIRQRVYDLYRTRAEVPEIVAPTVRGSVGVMLAKPAEIKLPAAMEHLRERATLDGLSLADLHRRMAFEVMTVGRYGLLPGVSDGVPHLSGYVAESIVSWDSSGGALDFVSLDETAQERNRETGQWEKVERYRVLVLEDGRFVARIFTRTDSGWEAQDEPEAMTPRRAVLDALPFVFVGTNDLTPQPDDVPLYGLAKLAIRVYRLDADFTWSLHMTSEPTPWVNGFDDPETQATPSTLGSAKLWVLPSGAQAGYLEFSGPGLEKQAAAIKDALDRAAQFGAQVIQQGQAAESGEALKLRAASQTATLTTIAQTTAGGLERALRNIAVWIGANPDEVVVTPNLEFFDRQMTPQDIQAVVAGWQAGAYSHETLVRMLLDGGAIPEGMTVEEVIAGAENDLDAP
ncbi:DUF4055 domain-containing protein [Paracoccus siganidrum]|uniref:DUF4055 domain-containing protein n=1 Tax=Paracoccus siganidrum TaxID=1276757 RepID=A0A419A6X8_9RHOB|nr:DUF4055 domain-containing protein [Paracoccus siganidrum]RJL15274.1 DUF4055 domain-containing protein [Paracoccus siganidrum]RMC39333.1 hypothetical protein C9E82_04975 [Paracoccus siganidrum]